MAISAHAHEKWKMVQNPAKTQAMYETGHGQVTFVQNYCQKDNCSRFCAFSIANEAKKIAEANLAKTWSFCQNFTSKRKQVMFSFANKVVE